MTDLEKVKERLKIFNEERNWLQYHKPKEILIAMMSEVGELADCYRWLTEEQVMDLHRHPIKKDKIEEEIADIFIYLLNLCHMTNIDIIDIIHKKIDKNEQKYPDEKMKGQHTNKIIGFNKHI